MRLLDAMKEYVGGDFSRFHMPGHKGKPPVPGALLSYPFDLTEIKGMDSLYEATCSIREVEREYAALYGSRDSLLCAGGATLCIQAMLAAALRPSEKLLACRGTHLSAVRSMALLDLHPVWLFPQINAATGLALAPSPGEIAAALEENPDVRAVYLTSPTYFGTMSDIAGIAALCHEKNIPLLVDNAHGAHLAFLERNIHPIALGADLCADSLHKTLPVLTGGAILHIGSGRYLAGTREKLALFGSTSPSYLVMGSADLALDFLRDGMREGLLKTTRRLKAARELAREKGFLMPDDALSDPARLVLGTAPLGYSGADFAAWLRTKRIEPEYAGGGWCVLMASPFLEERDYLRLEEALRELPEKEPIPLSRRNAPLPRQVMSVREATFADCETVPTEKAEGRIAGDFIAPCPPGIALVAAGEEIDRATVDLLTGYGIEQVRVVSSKKGGNCVADSF